MARLLQKIMALRLFKENKLCIIKPLGNFLAFKRVLKAMAFHNKVWNCEFEEFTGCEKILNPVS